LSVIDAQGIETESTLETDVCVVGAGAAGITITRTLAAAGRDVVLVESGRVRPDPSTQDLYALRCAGYPIRADFMSRARYFGGSCNLWAGRSMQASRFDLEARPWVNIPAWPISWDTLDAYHERAAEVLKLPALGLFDATAHAEKMTDPERALYADDRIAPTVSLWAKKPKRFRSALGEFRKSERVRALIGLNATNLSLGADGQSVERLDAMTLSGRRIAIRARRFVLACGGLENARLLLISRDRSEAGLANAYDQVGRCFMDHPRTMFGRVRLADGARLSLLGGRPLRDGRVQLGVGMSERWQAEAGLLNPYATLEAEVSQYTADTYQSFVQTMKVLLRRGYAGRRRDWRRRRLERIPGMIYLLTPRELAPHWIYRAHRIVRERFGPPPGGDRRVVVYFCEQPPDPSSRVTLGRERDALGVERLVLDWRIDPSVTESVLRLQELLAARLEAAGIGTLEPGEGEPRYTDASHHLGTTRMSSSPRAGVVDPDCRVHGIANLYVAGSSVFPTGGHKNPTLTLLALALRLADHLVRQPSG